MNFRGHVLIFRCKHGKNIDKPDHEVGSTKLCGCSLVHGPSCLILGGGQLGLAIWGAIIVATMGINDQVLYYYNIGLICLSGVAGIVDILYGLGFPLYACYRVFLKK
jgi:hypothetical protein